MKKIIFAILFLFIISVFQAKAEEDGPLEIYYFWSVNCPYCAKAEDFLKKLNEEYKDKLLIKKYEIDNQKENATLLDILAKSYGKQAEGTPTWFIGPNMVTGYEDFLENQISKKIQDCIKNNCPSPALMLENISIPENILPEESIKQDYEKMRENKDPASLLAFLVMSGVIIIGFFFVFTKIFNGSKNK